MDILLQLIFSGIALGMIYAVIAFGYQLTFATSGTLNFGQGEALMLGALVGLVIGIGLAFFILPSLLFLPLHSVWACRKLANRLTSGNARRERPRRPHHATPRVLAIPGKGRAQ